MSTEIKWAWGYRRKSNMSTRETLLLDYQRADHMFPVGIYHDPYSVKPQFQWRHILLHYHAGGVVGGGEEKQLSNGKNKPQKSPAHLHRPQQPLTAWTSSLQIRFIPSSPPPHPLQISKFYFRSKFKSIKLRKKYVRLFQYAFLKIFQWYYSNLF